ncbi:MAG: hypothetical protein WD314_15930 [Trueperaceae bacterium]
MRPFTAAIAMLIAVFATWPGTTVRAQTPFPDIAPCHWAAEAVTRIAGQPQVKPAQARNSTYLAENALHQVFEGLRCYSPEWSRSFLADAPADWPTVVPNGPVVVQIDGVRLDGDRGVLSLNLRATLAGREVSRSGEIELTFQNGAWLVAYDSLAALDLPLFP